VIIKQVVTVVFKV